jgi:hypothetical protein
MKSLGILVQEQVKVMFESTLKKGLLSMLLKPIQVSTDKVSQD